MLFNSWEFFIFFPIVTILFYTLPHRWRWLMLLVSSCIFYMSFVPSYIFILFATIIIDYFAGILIDKSNGKVRTFYLLGSVVFTCIILFFFKYFDFFAVNFTVLAHLLDWNYSISALHILLPIGLSFHTFQSLSYVIEVHRGNQKPERHFGIYALYVMFYPQLVAGPIERPQNLLHQFHEKHDFDYKMTTDGLKLMAWGFFKKVVIADRLSLFVNPVYDHPTQYSGCTLLIATIFFSFQIFCDFSGYSDIARGAAKVMGFKLMRNFDRPYSSKTLSEFWKRWHISLSTWLRDYIYEPIAMHFRDLGVWGAILSLMVTFLVSGIWHGANWTFIIWGLLHGAMLSIELLIAKQRKALSKHLPEKLFNGISTFLTFSFVSLSYIFFRSKNLDDAIYILRHMTDHIFPINMYIKQTIIEISNLSYPNDGHPKKQFILSVALIFMLIKVHSLQKKYGMNDFISNRKWWIRWPVYQVIVFLILTQGVWFLEKRDFIYFQF